MNKEMGGYRILDGGRVKSAGVPLDVVFEGSQGFASVPTPTDAEAVTNHFASLRNGPPDEVRNRFFPRDRANKGMFKSGSILLRPILKTDQGAGKFLPFSVGSGETSLHYDVASESGYFMYETYFEEQLVSAGYPQHVMDQLKDLRKYFQSGDIAEAQLAYERFQIACDQSGLVYKRESQVGRDALFFIRPALPKHPIEISQEVKGNVIKALAQTTINFQPIAHDMRDKFAKQHGASFVDRPLHGPIYFQADVQLLPDGKALIDQIQLPDVGLFLTLLLNEGNQSFARVQEQVMPLKEHIIEAIVSHAHLVHQDHIYLVTRDEVARKEDTLEIREIAVLCEGLRAYGIQADVVYQSNAVDLQSNAMAILLNVDAKSNSFTSLLFKQLGKEAANFYPDPFLLLAKDHMTAYDRIRLTSSHLEALHAIVKDQNGTPLAKTAFSKLLALDGYLQKLGITEQVLHFHIASQLSPVPVFRYDLRGLQIALNYIQLQDDIVVHSVPIDPQRAVLFQNNRPLYSVFRFMLVEEGI